MHPIAKLLFTLLLALAAQTAIANAPQTVAADSSVVSYHENGKVKEKGKLRNGEKHGKWKTYDENGALLKETKYKNGIFWWERIYNKKGKLSQIIHRDGTITKLKDCGC